MDFDLESGIRWYLVFLFSTVLHEAAHAWTAHRLGDDTAYRGGQVTLDPIPHIRREPIGMVVVPILSFLAGGWMIGWASAPYSVAWARQFPRRAALMALAGPTANALLLLGGSVLILLGAHFGVFSIAAHPQWQTVAIGGDGLWSFAAMMLSLVVSLNLLLLAFNLLPLPPLDGASLPLLVLPNGLAARYSELFRHPGLSMAGMFLAWHASGVVLPPLFHAYYGGMQHMVKLF